MNIKLLLSAALLAQSTFAFSDINITDIDGRHITLEGVPEKIALGFYYEDFLAVAGTEGVDKLVSISQSPWKSWRPGQWAAYTDKLPSIAQLPDFGNIEDGSFSTEALIASKPDVAILSSRQVHSLGEGLDQLEAAGIDVVAIDYNAQTLEKHLASTEILGQVMGQERRAQELAQMYENFYMDTKARVKAAKEAGAKTKKVYVELAKKGPESIGNTYGNGMWAGVINALEGQNIAAGQIDNWGPLSPEYVIAQQPDVILLAGSEWLNSPKSVQLGFGAKDAITQPRMAVYTKRPGWQSFPAVKEKQIYGIYHGGNRTLSDYVYARAIGKALYPKQFEDVKPAQELKEFYHKWMPIEADGLFVTRLK